MKRRENDIRSHIIRVCTDQFIHSKGLELAYLVGFKWELFCFSLYILYTFACKKKTAAPYGLTLRFLLIKILIPRGVRIFAQRFLFPFRYCFHRSQKTLLIKYRLLWVAEQRQIEQVYQNKTQPRDQSRNKSNVCVHSFKHPLTTRLLQFVRKIQYSIHLWQ